MKVMLLMGGVSQEHFWLNLTLEWVFPFTKVNRITCISDLSDLNLCEGNILTQKVHFYFFDRSSENKSKSCLLSDLF